MTKRNIKHIGIELELAVMNETNVPHVAGRYINATKEEPLDIDGNLIHKDASMVEIAMRPAKSAEELEAIYHEALAATVALLPDNVHLLAQPAVVYSEPELTLDPYASVMGCSISSNVYGLPGSGEEYKDNTRYSGMHVNIEVDDADELDAFKLDSVLGLYSVANWESEHAGQIQKRRSHYGKAGEHRIKEFGIEYRTLPSSSFKVDQLSKVWAMVKHALNMDMTDELESHADMIRYAIQACDSRTADELLTTIHGENPAWAM